MSLVAGAAGHGAMVSPRSRNSIDVFANPPVLPSARTGMYCQNVTGAPCNNGQVSVKTTLRVRNSTIVCVDEGMEGDGSVHGEARWCTLEWHGTAVIVDVARPSLSQTYDTLVLLRKPDPCQLTLCCLCMVSHAGSLLVLTGLLYRMPGMRPCQWTASDRPVWQRRQANHHRSIATLTQSRSGSQFNLRHLPPQSMEVSACSCVWVA